MITQTQLYPTHIRGFKPQTSTIRLINLEIPADYPPFQPGHVIHLQIPREHPDAPVFPLKTYSICSLPEDGILSLCVDLVNAQGVSGALHHASPGTALQISGPLGSFLLPDPLDQPLLLIGLGSGVGAVWALLRRYEAIHSHQPVHFYAINCDEPAIPFHEELEVIGDTLPLLEVYPVLQTNGYDIDEIVDRILSHAKKSAPWRIYLAGPYVPVHELRRHLRDVGFSQRATHVLGYQ